MSLDPHSHSRAVAADGAGASSSEGYAPRASWVDARLARPDVAFSPAAHAELKRRVDEYEMDVTAEARRIAARHQADAVSPAYVRQASERLAARTRQRGLALAGTFGGIFLGAAVSGFVDLASAPSPSPVQMVASGALGFVGSFFIALQYARE